MTARKTRPPVIVAEPERPLVAPPSLMDDQTFIKHFNARHTGGVSRQGPIDHLTSWPDQIATFRAFHRQAHEGQAGPSSANLNHTHDHGDQPWQDPEGE